MEGSSSDPSETCVDVVTESKSTSISDVQGPPDAEQDKGKDNSNCVCMLCKETFSCLAESLRHDLLVHSNEMFGPKAKSSRARKVPAATAALASKRKNDNESAFWNIEEAAPKIRDLLAHSEPGHEIDDLIHMHKFPIDQLRFVVNRVRRDLRLELAPIGHFEIFCFGSISNGLSLRDCDIDIYIGYSEDRNLLVANVLNKCTKILYTKSEHFNEVVAIRKARVPIIKCVHIETGFKLDINFSCPASVFNSRFIHTVVNGHPIARELMLFLKIWAKYMKIIGPAGLTSYSWAVLVLFYMQQSLDNYKRLIMSVKEVQERLNRRPRIIMGVNYDFDPHMFDNHVLFHNIPPTMELIRGFFDFYANFDFDKYMVAPYLGKAVPIEEFKSGQFDYDDYWTQKEAIEEEVSPDCISNLHGIELNRCMVVQDPFALLNNVTKSVRLEHLNYVRKHLKVASDICHDPDMDMPKKLYAALLCDTKERVLATERAEKIASNKAFLLKYNTCGAPSGSASATVGSGLATTEGSASGPSANAIQNLSSGSLDYRIIPCRSDLRALSAAHTNIAQGGSAYSEDTLYSLWLSRFEEVIMDIISTVYLVDSIMYHAHKQPRMGNVLHTRQWKLSASLDTWTGRQHVRKGDKKTFMEVQLEQTKMMRQERLKDTQWHVNFNAILTINALVNGGGIEIVATPDPDHGPCIVTKKSPIRKFFCMLKYSLQNFSLKEHLLRGNAVKANAQNETSNDSVKGD